MLAPQNNREEGIIGVVMTSIGRILRWLVAEIGLISQWVVVWVWHWGSYLLNGYAMIPLLSLAELKQLRDKDDQ